MSSSEWFRNEAELLATLQRGQSRVTPLAPELPGYEDLIELRRGGQGVVYTGRHAADGRRVAIKVLLGGAFASERSRRRFEREIELVRGLRHPNIVRVLDSGGAEEGRLFLVMEYIDGVALDEFLAPGAREGDHSIDARGNGRTTIAPLSIEATLELFARIGAAVHFAHQRGVIHRDLKPSNIRVDRRGEPHVLDFGLAKGLDGELEETGAALSLTGEFMGSLPWASPEQAAGLMSQLDVRSDVYSLGVMLYQFLVGRFPYEVSGPMHLVLQNIKSTEPSRPSSLRRELAGDLETIILKCLAKEPERRYQSVNELVADLRRYLASEPIEARRDSSWRQMRQKLARYRGAAFVLCAVGVAAIGFGAVTFSMLRITQEARADEQSARHEAQQEAARAQETQRFLETMLTSVRPEIAMGRDTTLLREILSEAEQRLGELRSQPGVQAQLCGTLGATYQQIAIFDRADELLKRSAELWATAAGKRSPQYIQALSNIASLRYAQGQLAEARQRFEEALELSTRELGPEDHATVALMVNLAIVLEDLSLSDESLALLEKAHEIYTRTRGPEHLDTLWVVNSLATRYAGLGRLEDAERLLSGAMRIHREKLGEDHPETLNLESNYISVINRLGRTEEAIAMSRSNVERRRRVFGPDQPDSFTAMNNLGHMLNQSGDDAGAARVLEEALEGRTRTLGAEHTLTLVTMTNLAGALEGVGKTEEAERMLRLVIDTQRRVYGMDNQRALSALNNLGTLLLNHNRQAEAAPVLLEACDVARRVAGPESWFYGVVLGNHADALFWLDQVDEAEREAVESLRILRAALGDADGHTRERLTSLVWLYESTGQPEKAEALRASTQPVSKPAERRAEP